MTHTVGDEPSSMSRLTGPGITGESSGTASGFEEACLDAVEDFRRRHIDRTTATTRIALAISNDCILATDDEQSTYQRYFSILDRYKNELRTASSQTRADRALAFRVGTENCARDQSVQEVRVEAEKRPQHGQGISTGDSI